MAGLRDKVPAETRWGLATKGLTGAYTAIAKAYRENLSEDKYNEFNGVLWNLAGKGAKEFADSIKFTAKSPGDVVKLMDAFVFAVMGPEFQSEAIETTEDRCVQRATKCPWHERWKEQGLVFDYCTSGHQAWGEGVCESLNTNFAFSVKKNMTGGDPHCEFVIERKK
jgi:hypothetical protein